MKKIHCIGDSHSCFFYGSDEYNVNTKDCIDSLLPYFKVYPVGPALAYNLGTLGTMTKGREIIFGMLEKLISVGSRIMLCFGEIDCRYHIFRQARIQQKDFRIIAEDCVRRYFDFIKEIKAKGYEVLVWATIPSARDFGYYDPNYPRLGTCEERNCITKYFNEKLKSLLDGESIKFISIFDQLVDGGNVTRDQYYLADNVHLSQKIMPAAIKELRNNITDFEDKEEMSCLY